MPWVAEWLLRVAAHDPEALQPDSQLMSSSGSLLRLWHVMLNTSRMFPDSPEVQPAAWLAAPLLQLAHAVMQVPAGSTWRMLANEFVHAAVIAFKLSAHPQLCKWVTGKPGDAVLGATVAEALREVRLGRKGVWTGPALSA